MSQATIRGIVHHIDTTKTYGQKGFRKRLVVLEEVGARFTNYVPVDFIQEGCDTVDDLRVGNEVEVTYRLSGRKWQKDPSSEVKYFLNAEAINFKILTGGEAASGQGDSASGTADANAALNEVDYDESEVPF